jgi:threonine/homoserine/homoserine lactone efflux protein
MISELVARETKWYHGNMDLTFLVKGIALGFSIAAPVGPIGVLCIRRTLAAGRVFGLATGLGAATADAFYGMVAGLGLTAISSVLVDQNIWLKLLGGGFLVYLGVTTLVAKPTQETASLDQRGVFGSYLSALFLTLTNPMTILFFVAVFAGLGMADVGASRLSSGLLLVAGTFTGSALWWLILTGGVGLLTKRTEKLSVRWVNRASGLILLAFGLSSLYGVL